MSDSRQIAPTTPYQLGQHLTYKNNQTGFNEFNPLPFPNTHTFKKHTK